MAVVAIALLHVIAFGWDQRAAPGELPDVLEQLSLLVAPDRHGPGTATFGPAGFELDVIGLDRVVG